MTTALIAFCCPAVVSFLSALAIAHLLSKRGLAWIVFTAIAVSAVSITYLLLANGDGPPKDADYLLVILAWSLFFPALSGAILGAFMGTIRKMHRNCGSFFVRWMTSQKAGYRTSL